MNRYSSLLSIYKSLHNINSMFSTTTIINHNGERARKSNWDINKVSKCPYLHEIYQRFRRDPEYILPVNDIIQWFTDEFTNENTITNYLSRFKRFISQIREINETRSLVVNTQMKNRIHQAQQHALDQRNAYSIDPKQIKDILKYHTSDNYRLRLIALLLASGRRESELHEMDPSTLERVNSHEMRFSGQKKTRRKERDG
jgi:hypothetical protein